MIIIKPLDFHQFFIILIGKCDKMLLIPILKIFELFTYINVLKFRNFAILL